MKFDCLRRSVPAFVLFAALASAQPSHAPVCQSYCWVRDDIITPGKHSCEPGGSATWCEFWKHGNGKCGDTMFNDFYETCYSSNDVRSGPCDQEEITVGGKLYRRIPSADDGINICCFYAVGSEVPGADNPVSRPTSNNVCNDGGGAYE